jgi:hypothetical protein
MGTLTPPNELRFTRRVFQRSASTGGLAVDTSSKVVEESLIDFERFDRFDAKF